MSNERIEFWLQTNGKIVEITDHEAFSTKIRNRPHETFNVAILGKTIGIFYNTQFDERLGYFIYHAMQAPVAQIQHAIFSSDITRRGE